MKVKVTKKHIRMAKLGRTTGESHDCCPINLALQEVFGESARLNYEEGYWAQIRFCDANGFPAYSIALQVPIEVSEFAGLFDTDAPANLLKPFTFELDVS